MSRVFPKAPQKPLEAVHCKYHAVRPRLQLSNDPAFTAAAREKKLESRYLDDIDLVLGLSEKVASIIFPDLEGKFDYVSFRTKDAEALNWAKSMFLYYWNKAKR